MAVGKLALAREEEQEARKLVSSLEEGRCIVKTVQRPF